MPFHDDAIQNQIKRCAVQFLPPQPNATLIRLAPTSLNALGEPVAPLEVTWPARLFSITMRQLYSRLIVPGTQLHQTHPFLLAFATEPPPTTPQVGDVILWQNDRFRLFRVVQQAVDNATYWECEAQRTHV
jgi:hypothetical protein